MRAAFRTPLNVIVCTWPSVFGVSHCMTGIPDIRSQSVKQNWQMWFTGVTGKGNGKVYSRTGHEGPEGSKGITLLFL